MMFFFVDRFVQLSSYSIDADSAHNYLFHCWLHLFSSCGWEYEFRRPREYKISVGSSGGGREQRVEVTKRVRSSFEAGVTKFPLTDTLSLYEFDYKTVIVVLLTVQRLFLTSIISDVTNIFCRHFTLTDIRSCLHQDRTLWETPGWKNIWELKWVSIKNKKCLIILCHL